MYGWHDHVYVWLVHRSLCGVGTCGCVFCWYESVIVVVGLARVCV